VLAFYKKLIQLRLSSDCLTSGDFTPLFAKGSVIAYKRELRDSGGDVKEAFCVMLNFSKRPARIPGAAAKLQGEIMASSTEKDKFDGRLSAWEGIILKPALKYIL
jgi:hypothetical protein